MIGIGWFECECGRTYRGFSRGDITSKCHNCQTENLPYFIGKGKRADKGMKTDNSHYCNACKGKDDCPILNQFQQVSSDDEIDISNNKQRLRRRSKRKN